MARTRAAIRSGDTAESEEIQRDRQLFEHATTCEQLAPMMEKYHIRVSFSSNPAAKLHRVKAQLRRLLPTQIQPASTSAAAPSAPHDAAQPDHLQQQPSEQQSEQQQATESPAEPPATTAHPPTCSPACIPATPQRRSPDAYTLSVEASNSVLQAKLSSAETLLNEQKAVILELQARAAAGADAATPRDPERQRPDRQSSPTPPRSTAQSPHTCTASFVFENVPGIVAGMRPCDAQPHIMSVLTHTLYIADADVKSFSIKRVSRAGVEKPVVVVQVLHSSLLSDILANKTAERLGPASSLHIYVHQQPSWRPGALRMHQLRRQSQRSSVRHEQQQQQPQHSEAAKQTDAPATRPEAASVFVDAEQQADSAARSAPASPPATPAPTPQNSHHLSPVAPAFVPSRSPHVAPAARTPAQPAA